METRACVITPTVRINRNDKNSVITDSPLYKVIYDIIKPYEFDSARKIKGFSARDEAWNIYTKTFSEPFKLKMEEAMQKFPDKVRYYGDTDDFTLPSLIWCTDILGLINQQDLYEWLANNPEFNLTSDNISELYDKINVFNNSEWGKIATARISSAKDSNGKIVNKIIISLNPIQELNSETHQDLPSERYSKFSGMLYGKLKNIFTLLNLNKTSLDELCKRIQKAVIEESNDDNTVYDLNSFPLTFVDTMIHFKDLMNKTSTNTGWKKHDAIILHTIIKNSKLASSPLYLRIANSVANMDNKEVAKVLNIEESEVSQMSKDEIFDAVFEKYLEQSLYKYNTGKGMSDIRVDRLLKSLINSLEGSSLLNIDTLIQNIIDCNSVYTTTDNIISFNNIRKHFNNDGIVKRLNSFFEKLTEHSIRLQKLAKGFTLDTNDSDLITFLGNIYSLQYKFEKSINSNKYTSLYPLFKQVVQILNKISSSNLLKSLDNVLKTVDTSNVDCSNNYLCGKLQLYRHILNYTSKCIDEIKRIAEEENKLGLPLEKRIVTQELIKELNVVEGVLSSKKKEVNNAIIKVVVNELKPYFGDRLISRRSDGKSVTFEEYAMDGGIDLNAFEQLLDSAAMCDNVIIGIAQDYKKKLSDEATAMSQDLREEISIADAKLKKEDPAVKDHSFMFAQHNGIPTGKFVMDYDSKKYWKEYTEYKKSLYKQHITKEEIARLLSIWHNEHLEKRDDLGGVYAPRLDMYANEEFNSWSNAKKEYWRKFMELKARVQNSYEEQDFNIEDGIYFRPSDLSEQLIEAKGFRKKWKAFKDEVMSFRSIRSYDTDLIKPVTTDFDDNEVLSLPLFYTKLFPGESMDDISKDLTRGLMAYADVVYSASAVSKGLNIMNGVVDVLEQQRILTNAGKRIVKEPLEGRTFSITKPINKSKYDKKTLKRYKSYLQMQTYGQYSDYKTSKLAKSLSNLYMGMLSMGTLALNINSAIANVLQGICSFTPEIFAKEFFSKKDVAFAFLKYNEYVFGIGHNSLINELGNPIKTNKLGLWLEYFDVMQDYRQDLKEKRYNNKWYNLINSSPLFFMQSAGEHMLQSITALSFAHSDRYALRDENNNKVNIFDAFDTEVINKDWVHDRSVIKFYMKPNLYMKDGRRIITKDELKKRAAKDNKQWNDASLINKDTEISELDFRHEIKESILGLNQYIHGIYNQEDKNQIQHYALGRMAIMYRKFMKPALNRRYEHKYYNPQLRQEVEGFYRTGGTYIYRLTKEYYNLRNIDKIEYKDLTAAQKTHLLDLGIDEEFYNNSSKRERQYLLLTTDFNAEEFKKEGKKGIRRALLDSMTEHEMANLKRVCSEFLIYQSLVMINIFLDLDDDDDDAWYMSKLKYLMRRLRTEVGALTPFSLLGFIETKALREITDNKELSVAGSMLQEMLQLITQPIPGMDLISGTINVLDLIFPSTWNTEIEKGKFAGHTEAYKILATLPTPIRQILRWNQQADIYATQYYNSIMKK